MCGRIKIVYENDFSPFNNNAIRTKVERKQIEKYFRQQAIICCIYFNTYEGVQAKIASNMEEQ